MIFEVALTLMREGKKAHLPDLDLADEYWVVSHSLFPPPGENLLHQVTKEGKLIASKDAWRLPTWALMSDEWEIKDELPTD